MRFTFSKYFFDLNIDRDTYVYFILVELKLGFIRIRNLTFHHYHAATGGTTFSKTVKVALGKDDWGKLSIRGKTMDWHVMDQTLNIFTNLSDLKIDLKVAPFGRFEPKNNLIIPLGGKRIEWFAVPFFMTGTGSIRLRNSTIEAKRAPVYIDHVFTDILPFNMPVSKMFWGRVLLQDMLVTYSVVITPDGKQRAKCFVFWNERRFDFSEVEYVRIAGVAEGEEPDHDENIYRLQARKDGNIVDLTLKHRETAATGAFIDPERYRFQGAYRFLNKLSKNPKGKKYLSVANLQLSIEGRLIHYENLDCIDEYVVFGQ